MAGLTRTDTYRAAVRELEPVEWDAFLQRESHLPGPRANLELLQVAADEGTLEQFRQWLRLDARQAPGNSAGEFLAACGAVGLGRLIAAGQRALLEELRPHASDSRWRVREGVAMGLQRLGAADMPALLDVCQTWSGGNWLEQRAAVAALCEPALLKDAAAAQAVLAQLDAITTGMLSATRRDEDFKVLRQALAYGWSVAVAALPESGKPLLEKWLQTKDRDVLWLARENLKKDRLKRMDRDWVAHWTENAR